MLLALSRKWWVFLLRGLCGIVFGILAFTAPAATLLALIVLWGAFAVAEGVTALAAGLTGRREGQSLWQLLIVGIAGLAAGFAAWVWPGITAFVLLSIIAAWSIVRGLFEIAAAVRLRKVIEGEWLLAAAGALSVLFGVLLLVRPDVGLLTLVYLTGAYALVVGALLVALAFRLRGLRGRLEAGLPPSRPAATY